MHNITKNILSGEKLERAQVNHQTGLKRIQRLNAAQEQLSDI